MVLRVAAIGECMVELSQRDTVTFSLAFGGDTLNTAVYLARATPRSHLAVDYVTALGNDPYSEAMVGMWRDEGIGTETVARLPGRLPGLYLIRIDAAGERQFFYYRSAAAARELFNDETTELQRSALPGYDLLYFSAITLSVLSETARSRLFETLDQARARGTRVAFDSNYRPAGWPDRATAQRVIGHFLRHVDIALPTADDEKALFGDADAMATAARYAGIVPETVVKTGGEGCLLVRGSERVPIPVSEIVRPVDTTAAGDAFNAGYLAARLAGRPPEAAAQAGHAMAAAVIRHRGAIIPRQFTPRLDLFG
jgi:2-dehydro-3-deoxygluconokinase